jgi:hypothetical protein
MPAELNTSYILDSNDFNIYATETINISNIQYLSAESNRSIRITLAAAVPANSTNLFFSLNSHAFLTMDNHMNDNSSGVEITAFDQIDLSHDGSIDIVDLVIMMHQPTLQLDLNHDNDFDRKDIGLLLEQI